MVLFLNVLPPYSDMDAHDGVLHEADDHAGRRLVRFGRLGAWGALHSQWRSFVKPPTRCALLSVLQAASALDF